MKVRINREEPTAAQRRALKNEVKKEFDKLLGLYNKEVALQVLNILHFDFGFGQSRLQKFADKLTEMQIETLDRYEMSDEDTPWLCEKQLREDGINLDELLKG
jgi:hypothetical protein